MSHKTSRKSHNATAVSEEKEKVDTPVKEMKKKLAANAEKDKLAAEKTDKSVDKPEKSESADKHKPAEKTDKKENKSDKMDKNAEKPDKTAEKKSEKPEKIPEKKSDKAEKIPEKKSDKTEKIPEKKSDKTEKIPETKPDKPEKTPEKKLEKSEKSTDNKSDKGGDKKADKPAEKKPEVIVVDESKGDKTKEKGGRAVNGHNGAANGDDANGTVSDGSDADLVIEEDEAFPELTYDDSDTDADDAPSRSLTRRSQVKATKTPETPAPRPASEKESDDSKESKVLKLSEVVAPSDRVLRSADSPKPDARKDRKQDDAQEEEKRATKKDVEGQEDADKQAPAGGKADETPNKMEVEVIIDVETLEDNVERCAPRTRARISPYSRSRLDRTTTSVTADYTGNNSTMEMDITESSVVEEPLNDSAYLSGLRNIRGRTSYKLLREVRFTNPNAGRPRHHPPPTAATVRPTGAVVGRKRKPSTDAAALGVEVGEEATDDTVSHGKRMKLLDRLSMPFRRSVAHRAAEIVGINTDLPLTAPVASTSFSAFDPETIKPAAAPGEPVATPLPVPPAPLHDRDGKRCIIM